jgi:hypothetical protein
MAMLLSTWSSSWLAYVIWRDQSFALEPHRAGEYHADYSTTIVYSICRHAVFPFSPIANLSPLACVVAKDNIALQAHSVKYWHDWMWPLMS